MCEVLVLEPDRHAVLRYVLDREWVIAGGALVVPKGAWTVSHYWTDRPYNVYHWIEGGRTIAFYVNIAADTTIDTGAIAYTDLVVDVLLRPSGAIEVLDEEELPPDLDPRHRLAIAKALETCITEARRLIAEIERETRAALA